MEQKEYEALRDKVIAKYRILYKDALAMDLCEVPKDVRIRMLDDSYYINKTKAIKANLFAEQLETLDSVISGSYSTEETKDRSQVVLKALEMKEKLLLEDLNVTKDESNALNVTFVSMNKEDFEANDTVEVFEGGNTTELGADFGGGGDTDSFEARMKANIQEKLKEREENKEV